MATAIASGGVDPRRVVAAFRRYMEEGGHQVTRVQFERNLVEKLEDKRFLSDMPPLLAAGQAWDAPRAASIVIDSLFPLFP